MRSSPSRPVAPPRGGLPPPAELRLPDGEVVWLRPVAEEVARRLRAEFPDEAERYGDAGLEWCVHDNQHLVRWASLPPDSFDDQVAWLAAVLRARGYPLERLARDLELAADVVREHWGERAAPIADALRRGAGGIASDTS